VTTEEWLDSVQWGAGGLVPAIAQEAGSGAVLTLAWMNREALAATASSGLAHYLSRSRGRLWKKGEKSGHVQEVREIRLDCDNDAILLIVEQRGVSPVIPAGIVASIRGSKTASGAQSTGPRDPRTIYAEK
jgi:phosphoribosyl-AMP cyclohydrolase